MAGFSNDVVYGNNVDFSGANPPSATISTDGQLIIGSTALNAGGTHINIGNIVSPLGTLAIGYSSPNITLDITGGSAAIEKVNVDTTTGGGTNPVLPTSGAITITGGQYASGTFGARVITAVSTAANTLAIQAQISATNASSSVTKNGVCHFNSSQFTVDANGYVSSLGNTMSWQPITASQTLVKNNGYICISPGGALSLALPSTASSTLGDLIEVTLDGATSWTITQAVGQQIRIANSQTTSGAGGSIATTASGDTIKLVYQGSGRWNVISYIGNLTVT